MTTYKSLEEALEALRENEIQNNLRYSVVKSCKGFGCISLSNARRVFFKDRQDIRYGKQDFDGVPFVCLGHKELDCQFGRDHKKKRKERNKKKQQDDHCYQRGQKFILQPSKKLGCPAKCVIREICKFPSYKVEKMPSVQERKMIEADILSHIGLECNVVKERLFVLCLPSKEDHDGHPIDKFQPEPVDKRVAEKIKELSRNGVRSVVEMKRHLASYVGQICQPLPHPSNKRFYPKDKIISNHMYVCDKMRVSLDQENLHSMVNCFYI